MCPLAVIAFYLSATAGYSPKERLATAKIACWIAWCVMVVTAIGGQKTLEAIGVAMEAFKIAGGLLLAVIGFGMLRSDGPEGMSSGKEPKEGQPTPKKVSDIAIVPLGVPLMAGPGTLAIVLSNTVTGEGAIDFTFCLIAISVVVFLMYWIFFVTSKGIKWLTPTILKLGFRLSGLFLVAMGVQLVMNGLKETDLMTNLANQDIVNAFDLKNSNH
jgi:multiple antibiotic resistance protein